MFEYYLDKFGAMPSSKSSTKRSSYGNIVSKFNEFTFQKYYPQNLNSFHIVQTLLLRSLCHIVI
jgi:hypothetical protein